MTNLSDNDGDVQLRALSEAVLAITGDLDLGRVLDRIAHIARSLFRVRYAALGVPDQKGGMKQFHTSGMTPAQIAHMEHTPRGLGLLGVLLTDTNVIRLEEMRSDPRSAGFCKSHPHMTSFLGAPIMSKGKHLGNLYLSDRVDKEPFTEQDERLIQLLAAHAAIAIENAQLSEQLQHLAVLEERDRISMELHDGIIQQIYAVGMKLELANMSVQDSGLASQLAAAMNGLNQIIDDLRSYIRNLNTNIQRSVLLKNSLLQLVEDFKATSSTKLDVTIEPLINIPDDEQGHVMVQITREALSNIARHAHATHGLVTLRESDRQFELIIEDNGQGFDPATTPRNQGLNNIEMRAERVGGSVEITSAVGQGTSLHVLIPFNTQNQT